MWPKVSTFCFFPFSRSLIKRYDNPLSIYYLHYSMLIRCRLIIFFWSKFFRISGFGQDENSSLLQSVGPSLLRKLRLSAGRSKVQKQFWTNSEGRIGFKFTGLWLLKYIYIKSVKKPILNKFRRKNWIQIYRFERYNSNIQHM
jgi:hypothetical protein